MQQPETNFSVRDALVPDESAWRRLWALYNAFYGQAVPDAVTTATWRRILDPAAPIFARVAVRDAMLTGFAVYVLHDCTWTIAPVCYLEDLFVDPAQRNSGVGRALIEDGLAIARARGFARMYWHTKSDNAVARRLYDGFAGADGFVRYRVNLT